MVIKVERLNDLLNKHAHGEVNDSWDRFVTRCKYVGYNRVQVGSGFGGGEKGFEHYWKVILASHHPDGSVYFVGARRGYAGNFGNTTIRSEEWRTQNFKRAVPEHIKKTYGEETLPEEVPGLLLRMRFPEREGNWGPIVDLDEVLESGGIPTREMIDGGSGNILGIAVAPSL